MPEQDQQLLNTIRALSEYLPWLGRLRLCPSYVALKVALCLRGKPGSCLELKEFEVTVTAIPFQAKCSVVGLGYMVILEYLTSLGLGQAKGAM